MGSGSHCDEEGNGHPPDIVLPLGKAVSQYAGDDAQQASAFRRPVAICSAWLGRLLYDAACNRQRCLLKV